ncbi:hypothetical protein Nepgr_013295 [Nepenthes gracilis]|uniref:Uncharacterized protein n=1 Tax=Nepenthes gracilis TaxID=150966 RepID=A0AAD3SIM2_NEPGR|nr:hypothetical protein Nepgr_013295 [Nepenthes gracilis]
MEHTQLVYKLENHCTLLNWGIPNTLGVEQAKVPVARRKAADLCPILDTLSTSQSSKIKQDYEGTTNSPGLATSLENRRKRG